MRDDAADGDALGALNEQLLAYARDLRGALDRARSTTAELSRTHLETVAALAAAIDVRDEGTGGHVYRVANYGLILADHVAPELAADPQIVYGFLLHDIGKLGVPDRVLLKPGPLDADEEAQMRLHVDYGVKFIEQIGFLRPALQVVATHHESWDGSGYPRGLAGEEIPLATRLFAVCDAFDAMVYDRPYRDAIGVERALAEIRAGAGVQFDPVVARGFEEVVDDLLEVSQRPEVPRVDTPQRTRVPDPGLRGNWTFEAVDEGLLLVGPDGVIRDVNRRFMQMFGLSAPPVGMTLVDLAERTADRFADPARARAEALSAPREMFRPVSESLFDLVAPEERVVRRIARTLYDDNGTAIGRLFEYRDVTSLVNGRAWSRTDDGRWVRSAPGGPPDARRRPAGTDPRS